jgi:hypothetical protein
MKLETIKKDSAAWVTNDLAATPEAGHDAHVREAIAQGKAQLDAGQGIPAEQVWEELGIE